MAARGWRGPARSVVVERRCTPQGVLLIARRNCALSPCQLAQAYLAIALVSLAVASVCAALGAWVVVPWAGVELLAVGVAFLWWGRHANDGERILVGPLEVRVEVCIAEQVVHHDFNRQWVQLEMQPLPGSVRVSLRERSRVVEVGRHLAPAGRKCLARELRAALA